MREKYCVGDKYFFRNIVWSHAPQFPLFTRLDYDTCFATGSRENDKEIKFMYK